MKIKGIKSYTVTMVYVKTIQKWKNNEIDHIPQKGEERK